MVMEKEIRGKVQWTHEIGFILVHLSPLLIFVTGGTFVDWMICLILYFGRMFFVTAGYHRYFAHKTYKTSRVFQFIIAFFAQTSLQKGALWWASSHRDHHKFSDTPPDPHSNKIYGFWYSHIGWIVGPDFKKTHYDKIKDFAKFPELVWLNKAHLIPPLFLMVVVFVVGGYLNAGSVSGIMEHGWSSLVIGFFTSTVILLHGTFTINSLTHMFGSKRYKSNDESRNNFFLALITMGEGWHNNHHYYQSSVRQGFYWWEIDVTYYILKMMSWVGLVWDLRPIPKNFRDARSLEEVKHSSV
jgi:stearoyl-CoA desaturase (delta-9 desaturase)